MVRFVLLVTIFFLGGATTASAKPIRADAPFHRVRYNFNQGWLVQTGDVPGAQFPGLSDRAWKRVTLPYSWNEDFAFKVSIHDLPTGIAWYRKHFRVPPNSRGQRIFVEFEGIRMAGEVYVNGRLLGRHEDGVAAFGFDITSFVLPELQDNVIAVRIDNDWKYKEKATGTTFHWNDTNFYANYGGINKNVWLHVMAPLHQTLPLFSSLGTTGTYIWASQFDLAHHAATITAETQVRNDSPTQQTFSYQVEIRDINHRTLCVFVGPTAALGAGETRSLIAASPVKGLQFWSWGYGYLYDVITTLSAGGRTIDAVTTRTGFRETSFDHGLVQLNGRTIDLHGYGQRTTNEWPALGIDVPPWVSDFSNQLMVQSNGNFVRWMHVTPSRQDTESSDRAGLLVSMPAGDAEGDSQGRQWEQRVNLMRDSIIYNRNSPSIIFYESGNHGISDAHMAEMKAVRDEYDPHGGRAAGAREMLASKVAEYGGEMLYVDKSATKPLWAHEYNRDEGARAYWDNDSPPFHHDSPLYNRDQDSAALEDITAWDDYYRARPGTGNRVSAGGANIIFSDSNTHYRGDNNYRRSGEVDAMRIPKDGFFAHQVMWNGWVEPERSSIFLLGHWNYPLHTVRPVYVVAAKAARVELKLNGRKIGSIQAASFNPHPSLALDAGTKAAPTVRREPSIPAGQSNDFLFTFPDVAFAPGTLEAIAFDSSGRPVATTRLRTARSPTSIRLTPHTGAGGLRADGSDLALVDVEIVDNKGQRCPTADPRVSFQLTGPAEWRGGIAQGSDKPAAPPSAADLHSNNPTPLIHEDNYILATTLPIENGINRVSVRSRPLKGNRRGVIVLTAYDPTAGLSSYLKRGPTPPGDAVHPTRESIGITNAIAGSDEDKTALSYDDNESTSWSSDGRLSTAWIEYTLAEPSIPFQLDLKVNAFRTRRYPLRVTLDGTILYEGTTPNSLGYVTIPLQAKGVDPIPGTHLRITLTANPMDGDRVPGTAEITGKYDGAGVVSVPNDRKAVLNIIETDIYKSVSPIP
jgi:beta-galactosidase